MWKEIVFYIFLNVKIVFSKQLFYLRSKKVFLQVYKYTKSTLIFDLEIFKLSFRKKGEVAFLKLSQKCSILLFN